MSDFFSTDLAMPLALCLTGGNLNWPEIGTLNLTESIKKFAFVKVTT